MRSALLVSSSSEIYRMSWTVGGTHRVVQDENRGRTKVRGRAGRLDLSASKGGGGLRAMMRCGCPKRYVPVLGARSVG